MMTLSHLAVMGINFHSDEFFFSLSPVCGVELFTAGSWRAKQIGASSFCVSAAVRA